MDVAQSARSAEKNLHPFLNGFVVTGSRGMYYAAMSGRYRISISISDDWESKTVRKFREATGSGLSASIYHAAAAEARRGGCTLGHLGLFAPSWTIFQSEIFLLFPQRLLHRTRGSFKSSWTTRSTSAIWRRGPLRNIGGTWFLFLSISVPMPLESAYRNCHRRRSRHSLRS